MYFNTLFGIHMEGLGENTQKNQPGTSLLPPSFES